MKQLITYFRRRKVAQRHRKLMNANRKQIARTLGRN